MSNCVTHLRGFCETITGQDITRIVRYVASEFETILTINKTTENKLMKNSTARTVAIGGLIAALYIVLTLVTSLFGFSNGVLQLRLSEALCILPAFTPAAIPGLFIGCLLSNIIAGGVVWDIVFGSIATLIGAFGTYLLRKNRWLCIIPPIISNAIIIPLVLTFAYGVPESFLFLVFTIGVSEIISAGVLGELLYQPLHKHPEIFLRP